MSMYYIYDSYSLKFIKARHAHRIEIVKGEETFVAQTNFKKIPGE